MNSLEMTRYLHILRDIKTGTVRFRWASDSLARLLCSKAVAKLPHRMIELETPVGTAQGPKLDTDILAVPIYRAGQALVSAFLEVVPQATIGSLLIQRDEETAQPKLIYKKLPPVLPKHAIILDPMLATGGSAVMAVKILQDAGYSPDKIWFVGVIASQEGYNTLAEHISTNNITVSAIDSRLNEKKYIDPGLGDYGDRYFGT